MKILRYDISLIKSDKSVVGLKNLTMSNCVDTINQHIKSEYNTVDTLL